MKVNQFGSRLDILDPVPIYQRIFIFVIGCIPMFGPYALLIAPQWQDYTNMFFMFAVVLSLVATALAFMLYAIAINGRDTSLTIDRKEGVIIYRERTPIRIIKNEVRNLEDFDGIDVCATTASKRAENFHLAFRFKDNEGFDLARIASKKEAEALSEKIRKFVRKAQK